MGKRIAIVFLAFLLVFSNFSFASAMVRDLPNAAKQKPNKALEELKETVDPEEEVRVIVEMEDKAPIEIATQRGMKYESLAKSEKNRLEKAAQAKQKKVKDEIKQKKIKAKELQEFTTVVNGFSIEVKQADLEKIVDLPDVKAIHVVNEYERPEVEQDMIYSKELVQAQQAWRDYGFKGEGMVVGVIDSGVDPTHRDMILSDNETGKLTESFVNDVIAAENLPGQYYTEKVPYGYNYMDENDEIREIHANANYHGMHVAGTVGANGDEENGGILGIAPEAQILALKVFGNDPDMQSTFGDIYIKAIDDAIKLGADVLNMSLGSGAGFVDPESPEQQAVTRAVENGVLMSISAGNSALFGDGYYYPYASNPDYGVNGSPGVAYDSLQVASYENDFMNVDALEYSIDDESKTAAFLSAGSTHPNDVDEKEFEVVDAGLGLPEDFEDIDVEGKYALIQRGGNPFTEKALNAQENGAVGAIIYNNTDGIVNMASDPAITIPQLFMLKSNGDEIAAALQDGQAVTITFEGENATIENPDAGKMSEFTSWGLTPNLDFKPEITAPGGQILSTLNDNEYGIMSGTSMAAPHVAGGGALVLERVDNEFGYENADRVNLAKNLMMNTSTQIEFEDALVSPRRQGSGMMQLHAALSTPVVVTESATNEAKVALKEVTENTVSFELTATNYTDEAVSYEANVNVQTDTPVNAGSDIVTAPKLFGALDLGELATINGENTSTIEVPANGSTSFTVTIDVSSVDEELRSVFTNGYWLEGFVTLTDPTDNNPKLTVPYVGFKGEWDAAPIFDEPVWDETSYYGMTGVFTSTGDSGHGILGEDLSTGEIDPEKIAFSPNGDGIQDNALIVLSFLRNAKQVKFQVVDEDGKVLRTIRNEANLRKNYYDNGRSAYYSLVGNRAWDGKIAGKPAEEGKYFLQAEGVIDYPGAEPQTLRLPVILDVTEPEVEAALDPKDNLLTVEFDDGKGSGVAYWEVYVDGELVVEEPYVNGETEHEFNEPVDPEEQEVTVVAVDYAGNSTEQEAELVPQDTTAPDLRVTTPETLGVETDKEVVISGYATDASGISEITVDGVPAEVTYDEEKDRYNFSFTINHRRDGYYLNKIKAVDNAGNEAEFSRRYFVDSTPAKVNVNAKKKTKDETADLKVKIKDDLDQIDVFINGDHVYFNELSQPYGSKKFNETLEFEVALEEGENVFEVQVVDLGGHETVEYVTIEKQPAKEKPGKPERPDRPGFSFEDVIKNVYNVISSIFNKLWSIFG
ncbi:S8 family serine peptidase [Oceanobacillus luteolus]|uniref:S8 family serine peptidase n=1 Tax=Oceanobacillus luteolus TaxID=1274358 RepID=A0ABW4HX58_9BACI